MAAQLPGPVCNFLDALHIDAGTMCRGTSPVPGPQGTKPKPAKGVTKRDISPDDGKRIVAESATWKGTPYALVGALSVKDKGGDCSGSTNLIYKSVSLSYVFKKASDFPAYALSSGLFRELAKGDAKRDGDILSWSGHMAIYSSFAGDDSENATTERKNKKGEAWTQHNDMWTASHPPRDANDHPPAYGPAEMKWWGLGTPRVFRYQK